MTCLGNLEMTNELEAVGDELQKISVMKNLPSLIKEDLQACVQRVVPRMQQTLSHGTTEYNMSACEAIRTVASQNLMTPDNFTKVFLHHILSSLESRDTVAADEWLNTLLDIIPVLPIPTLQNDVLPIAVNKAHISKPVPFRINSCKILGRLALTFTPYLVKKEIVPVVISLCQDVSGDVRAAMTAELPNISATLGQETSSCLMPYILDLNLDENKMVQEAIVEAIAHMLPRFPPDVLKTAIIPNTKKVFPEIVKNENNLLLPLSRFYGQYAIGLKNVMTLSEKSQFLQRYIQMSQMNANTRKINPYKPIVIPEDEEELALRLTECRLNCAYNYPAMVLFATDMKQDLVDNLFAVLRSLASDSFYKVRRKIAAGFFEVMKLMPRWHAALKIEFVRLLRDDIDVVQEGLVPNISDILLSFSASSSLPADKPDSGKDVGQALFVCEKILSEASQWRLHEEFLLALRVAPKVFHPEFVYLYFVSLLMNRAMNGRILPCRVAALHTLLVILADPSQAKQKLKIRNKVLELCNNSSFHCRLLFLRGMGILLNISPDIAKELFFHNITSMAEDAVPNIRLVLCKMLPKLKALAQDPLDRKLLACVDSAVSTLSAETDRDVCAQLKIARNQMEELDKSKGTKRGNTDPVNDNFHVSPKAASNIKLTTLTERGANSESSTRNVSQYAMVNPRISGRQKLLQGIRHGTMDSTVSDDSTGSVRSIQRPSMQRPAHHRLTDPGRKRSLDKLSPDDFLVDAGISLKATTEGKRIPTPRPVHRTLTGLPAREIDLQTKPEPTRRSLFTTLSPMRPSLSTINKNVNLPNYTSNLPVKKTHLKPLSNDEIEKELLQSDTFSPFSCRTSSRLKYTPNKTMKKENKRLSLDVGEIVQNHNRPETRSSNVNKRYSLDVDSKKELVNKKSLTCINNNTLLSPKLGSTRSGVVRPQSCLLEREKVNHSKRSMSVENLPPKVTRLASRLPVRSTDPKPSKPK